MEKVEAYKSENGKVYLTIEEAKRADEDVQIEALLEDIGVGRGGSWSNSAIAKAIIDRKDDLRKIFCSE